MEDFIRAGISTLWAFFVTVFSIPYVIHLAHLKQLLDAPNQRTIHESSTPRLGGLSIFAGFASAFTIYSTPDFVLMKVFAGTIILFFIGLKDDILPVSAFKKFFIQVLATGIVMFLGDIRICSFHGIFGIYQLPEGVSYMFTFVIIIGLTNAFNLIDGIDGLAGCITVLVNLVLAYIFIYLMPDSSFFSKGIAALSLVGAVAGFLRYNVHKAKIFMGDTGSLVCGFVTTCLVIIMVEAKDDYGNYFLPNSPLLGMSLLVIPIVDTLRVFIIRVLQGRSPFDPDKNHLHHTLLNIGLNQLQTLFVLIAVNILFISVFFYFKQIDLSIQLLLLVGLGTLVAFVLGGLPKLIRKQNRLL
ncbi:MAG TPA: MraY family glycosyltransferase [Cytophagaceae bacterium]|jgi:UDP-GlcNAc:undecaprenyl-phosphate GlcNAc-1-phosphate transferase|nr:MraY family glycosyltransferase [Cytophagaceae bacterium]